MSIDNSKMLDLREGAQQRKKPVMNKAEQLEKIYQPTNESKKEMQNISQPARRKADNGLGRIAIFMIALISIGAIVYYFATRNSTPSTENNTNSANEINANAVKWYSVKLVNGESYFGQISDLKANPLKMDKVYYNYDQAKVAEEGDKAIPNETGNLRLVKRGKETHGPTGEMFIYQSQVIDVEPLADDSKVLKAILEYEK